MCPHPLPTPSSCYGLCPELKLQRNPRMVIKTKISSTWTEPFECGWRGWTTNPREPCFQQVHLAVGNLLQNLTLAEMMSLGQSVCWSAKVHELAESARFRTLLAALPSPCSPSSRSGSGVALPSKHNEHLGLNIDFSHPGTSISNRFLPYMHREACPFCEISYS